MRWPQKGKDGSCSIGHSQLLVMDKLSRWMDGWMDGWSLKLKRGRKVLRSILKGRNMSGTAPSFSLSDWPSSLLMALHVSSPNQMMGSLRLCSIPRSTQHYLINRNLYCHQWDFQGTCESTKSFQISFVEGRLPFWRLGKNRLWTSEFPCEL